MENYSFDELCRLAFDEDSTVSFNASIEIAKRCGVDECKILKNVWDIDKFFMD